MKRLPHVRLPAGASTRFAYEDPGLATAVAEPKYRRFRRAFRYRQPSPPPPPRRPRPVRWQRWFLAAALFCLPALVYWPTIFQRYGFRDDYSVLRESHEEPGKVTLVCAMQARPIGGAAMEASFRQLRGIDDLRWLRLGSALLLGLVGATFFWLLRAMKWDRWTAALAAALFMVLPCAQIVTSWAVGWPLYAAILVALAAFACAERAFDATRYPLPQAAVAGSRTTVRSEPPMAGRTVLGEPLGSVEGMPRARDFEPAARLGETPRSTPAPQKPAELSERAVAVQRGLWWGLAVLLVAISALIYQSNTLFYFVAVAAALWSRRRWTSRRGIGWLLRHVMTVVIGLEAAFALMMVAFAHGWISVSRRVALEHDWLGKLEWFVREPLQNALALIVLNNDAEPHAVHRIAALVGVVLVAGLIRAGLTRGWRRGAWWTLALGGLMVGSFAVNLVVFDRWPAYRVLSPLSATVVVALSVALLALGGRRFAHFGLLALLVPGVWLARRQTFDLIAGPQSTELRLLETGAKRIDPTQHPRVFVLTPRPQDHLAPEVFSDEFGSLSTDSDWVPKEMLKLIMHERYPQMSDVTERYTFASGRELPRNRSFDVVIDLRRIRELRPPAL